MISSADASLLSRGNSLIPDVIYIAADELDEVRVADGQLGDQLHRLWCELDRTFGAFNRFHNCVPPFVIV